MRLIDADALMREFADFVRASNNSDFADVPTWNDAVSLLGSAPTIEPKRGHWVGIDDFPHETWECDKCGKIIETDEPPHYCERCGARMDERREDG